MKLYILFICAVLFSGIATAQDDQKYVVKEGTRPKDTFSYADIYLFPTFTSGKVYFKNNHVGSGMMNFNRFTREIDFIQGKDTLALSDTETIKNVAIGNDVFYYQADIGYVQRMAENANVMFGKMESIDVADRRRQPNSGTSSTTSNGSYNSQITTGAGTASGLALKMVEKVDIIYRKKTHYYFRNAKGSFVKADKKSLLKAYPDKKEALNQYLLQNEVDFQNAESLQTLFNAMTSM
ncbi:MAG TPA: hypothetical protein VIN08_22695 [Ohtaekwangia sp.]|uniref:hypothetical protein n=1 Tax=Ohtaekwangia sp. TaxID=2066019 RepID=UPI002F943267